MSSKIKIVIAGIGGVGGFFGGMLAKQYIENPGIEIIFFARGQHLKQIHEKGLRIIHGSDTIVAIPDLATDNAHAIGIADYLIICTKSYHLEKVIQELKPSIGNHTVILPLLNGVDATEKIQRIIPAGIILQGCAYIVSMIKEAGVIQNTGNIQKLYFGLHGKNTAELNLLERILQEAGIDAIHSTEISKIVWEKFIFISATATATSYFDSSIGGLLPQNESTVFKLIAETQQIAVGKGIPVDPKIVEKTIAKLKAFPYDTTSSMHRDFKAAKEDTELEALTGYVIQEGLLLGIPTPTYDYMYRQLKQKNG